jgi:tRNA dimethylallyltransferase
MKQIAIVAPTASGKSALSLEIAHECNSYILSLDSLSVYKDIDIVSAKPNKEELSSIKHFGVDIVYPDEYFAVSRFIDEYNRAKEEAIKDNKNLIVVGGSSFYLKSMIDGLSIEPDMSKELRAEARDRVAKDVESEWNSLNSIDSTYMQNIKPTDSYRVEKALSLYLASNMSPTKYFEANPKISVLKDIPIYEIAIDRDILRDRIKLRTKMMLEAGLLEEIKMLEEKYTREPTCFKAIGIKETFDYFDGIYTLDELYEKIVTNTARLAKRQRTFNKTQLNKKLSGSTKELKEDILRYFND